MNDGDTHVGEFTSALVMLAAIASTFVTYNYYRDEVVANEYEAQSVALEQTASALVSLRLSEQTASSSTPAEKNTSDE